jgi:SpoVK/Ycf46/Vps4 family AAA+-type ATPase
MGILSKGHVVTVGSNDLLAGYVRQTGENTKKIIEKARGGILFIDEAYMLYKEDSPNVTDLKLLLYC